MNDKPIRVRTVGADSPTVWRKVKQDHARHARRDEIWKQLWDVSAYAQRQRDREREEQDDDQR